MRCSGLRPSQPATAVRPPSPLACTDSTGFAKCQSPTVCPISWCSYSFTVLLLEVRMPRGRAAGRTARRRPRHAGSLLGLNAPPRRVAHIREQRGGPRPVLRGDAALPSPRGWLTLRAAAHGRVDVAQAKAQAAAGRAGCLAARGPGPLARPRGPPRASPGRPRTPAARLALAAGALSVELAGVLARRGLCSPLAPRCSRSRGRRRPRTGSSLPSSHPSSEYVFALLCFDQLSTDRRRYDRLHTLDAESECSAPFLPADRGLSTVTVTVTLQGKCPSKCPEYPSSTIESHGHFPEVSGKVSGKVSGSFAG